MEIQGFPDYKIYEDGRVWSSRRGEGRFLKPQINSSGYQIVGLYNDQKLKHMRVNRLVALAYIPNPENKPEVDHYPDRCLTNNHVSNLRWATSSENGQNKGMMNSNTSGHKHVSYYSRRDRWEFNKSIRGVRYQRYFKSKIDCICYKYIWLLKQRSNLLGFPVGGDN